MFKTACILIAIFVNTVAMAQENEFYKLRADNSGYNLTIKGAAHLASLPLKCITQEFPNKTNHTSNSDSDHVLLPNQLHPVFYGCFDWHSSVHGHWMLIRLLKMFPSLPQAEEIRKALNKTFTKNNMIAEAKYFDLPLASSWERTYGWAWILKLDQELMEFQDQDARRWHDAMQPLTEKVISLWKTFLPKQTYPNRTGVHPNTAFGLVFALDYAREKKDSSFENAILRSAKSVFLNDKNAPVEWEPNGSDFLSPSLEEADLMRRVLPKADFIKWFNGFFPGQSLNHFKKLPVVSDRSDLQIVHLDGLSFSRSWCMRGLASVLPATDPRKKMLISASNEHLRSALPNVVSGHYGGEHWLASFAVYALLN